MVSGQHVRDAVAHRFDDARALVTEHHRPATVAEDAVDEVEVGVAHTGCGHANEYLARLRRVEPHVLDPDVTGLAQHRGRAS